MTKFLIKKNSKCLILKRGVYKDWIEHRTSKDLEFYQYSVADCGGRWQFTHGDWLLKIAPCFMSKDNSDNFIYSNKNNFKTCNKPSNKGKGASRRRNMRAMKSRKKHK